VRGARGVSGCWIRSREFKGWWPLLHLQSWNNVLHNKASREGKKFTPTVSFHLGYMTQSHDYKLRKRSRNKEVGHMTCN
jgi:hypothetical protein